MPKKGRIMSDRTKKKQKKKVDKQNCAKKEKLKYCSLIVKLNTAVCFGGVMPICVQKNKSFP